MSYNIMANIAVIGTLDTKGVEHGFVAAQIRKWGHEALLIDIGALTEPTVTPDITRQEVADEIGLDLAGLVARRDRGETVTAMAQAATAILLSLLRESRIDGVISLGGGGGTSMATTAMQALPLGFPKLMVSTLASGNTAPYVGVKDIVMFPSIVDVAGLNRISREILTRAAGAICGMVEARPPVAADRPIIVASMFGNTTGCVERAREKLEAAGYEVLVFHATGVGGRTMESLIETGWVAGVLDVTTTEWADECVGGILGAGPTRCEAAARAGIPVVIAPGCLDMVNFQERDSVPEKFKDRLFYQHNPKVTLMRTTPKECAEIGKILAEKCNLARGPLEVFLPLNGISVISAPGQPFHDAAADQALFDAWKSHLNPNIPVQELDANINDTVFADACAEALLRLIEKEKAAKTLPAQ
jgi:uncharacterized protein (UPF0261 family)